MVLNGPAVMKRPKSTCNINLLQEAAHTQRGSKSVASPLAHTTKGSLPFPPHQIITFGFFCLFIPSIHLRAFFSVILYSGRILRKISAYSNLLSTDRSCIRNRRLKIVSPFQSLAMRSVRFSKSCRIFLTLDSLCGPILFEYRYESIKSGAPIATRSNRSSS